MKWLTGYLFAINVLGFLTMGMDKKRAKQHKWRISERTLLGIAFAGGGVGIWSGMKVFHHKTRHRRFYIGVPFVIVCEIILLIVLL